MRERRVSLLSLIFASSWETSASREKQWLHLKITFVKVLLNWPRVFEILLPVSSTTACLIFLTLSPFHHFPCWKYITLVFCAFSDSPTLSHSISTLHKNIGTWTISYGQFYCHMYIYKHVFFTTLPYKRYIKKETNSPHHSNKMAIGFSLANFRLQVSKVNLVFFL